MCSFHLFVLSFKLAEVVIYRDDIIDIGIKGRSATMHFSDRSQGIVADEEKQLSGCQKIYRILQL